MADVLPFGEGARRKARKPRPRKYVWIDTIKADRRLQHYPHLSPRFLIDYVEVLATFSSFELEGVYAGRNNLARRLGSSIRQITRAAAAVADMGYTKVERRGRTSNLVVPILNGGRLFPMGPEVTSKVTLDVTSGPIEGGFDVTSGHPSLLSSSRSKLRSPPSPPSGSRQNGGHPADGETASDHGAPTNAMPSGEIASRLPREAVDVAQAVQPTEILPPGMITFGEFWTASGEVGRKGPAIGEWKKLSDADRAAIGAVVIREGSIDTGGVWSCNWLAGRGWEWPLPQADPGRRGSVLDWVDTLRAATPPPPSIEQLAEQALANGATPLRRYTDEWWTERKRLMACGISVYTMDQWAERGKDWPCL